MFESMSSLYEIRQCIIYINHINAFDIKHESNCVVSLVEFIMNFIKRISPYITRVIMQSDNAISYQNSIVPFFIHMLRISTGIFVSH